MRLILVRHGEALPGPEDFKRPLSPGGRRHIQELARYFKTLPLSGIEILHSDRFRAVETARILADTLGIQSLRADAGLSPNGRYMQLIDNIKVMAIERPSLILLVVGHLPFLGDMAEVLLAGKRVSFLPATAAGLSSEVSGSWRLDFIRSPADA